MDQTPQNKEDYFQLVPRCYTEMVDLPVIEIDGINHQSRRTIIVEDIANACKTYGFFQIVNHGIPQKVLDGALSTASSFFELPTNEKMKYRSDDVKSPVRYGTSLKDNAKYRRVVLKHYANPLDKYIALWPDNPHDYREKMSEYAKATQKLGVSLMGIITEGLGLGPEYKSDKMVKGVQAIMVNSYPPNPAAAQPDLELGLPPHSDCSCLSIVLQGSRGLQIQDSDGIWRDVSYVKGALVVNIGDCVEVMSNGVYKSVVHRVKILSNNFTRISIASLHSSALDEKVEVAEELVDDEKRPKGYKESTFNDFLNFISRNDISEGNYFIDTLRLVQSFVVPK
ncbi:OLC1v1019375C1 [Oldenlandia corymbosa var. corymbosa]|uniref:OLC1v1019375C1 n=1 Tax=Oldenlandia corymbosa var. corymbosa TaxID=529605 RepID=A0AAV1EEB7_OLDCO|nr:OLC1v1019375C1 [Oldenlandia corymbosa var. corymbosa]